MTASADHLPPALADKIVPAEQARQRVEAARTGGARIVFTNGCFDLLQADHVQCLHLARRLGDLLVVGLNSDASVRKLKGPGRPIHSLSERALILAGLASVDLVVPFEELTSAELLRLLRPELFVKGGDYTVEELDPTERAVVLSYGGRIRLIRCRPERSTTDTIARAAAAHRLAHPGA